MKKLVVVVTVILLFVMTFAACGGGKSAGGDKKATIGISMPSKELPIFYAYGNVIKQTFEDAGYGAYLEFAEDMTERQISQIENMMTKGVDYLIISAVDTASLTDICEKARDQGIKVIAGDRLIMNTEYVDHYVTFDLVRLGEIEGEGIEKGLGLKDGAKGPFTLEIFSGGSDDSNSIMFYTGAMNILQPYIDSGVLVVKSGQVDFNVNGILGWDSGKAQARMDNLLGAYYADTRLDAVLCAADCLALGVISSLESFGYGSADMPFPIISGADCELTAIDSIIKGKQYMTIFVDPVPFAGRILSTVEAYEANGEAPHNTTYFNGVIDVPTTLYDCTMIDKDNYMMLVDCGFYTKEDLASLG